MNKYEKKIKDFADVLYSKRGGVVTTGQLAKEMGLHRLTIIQKLNNHGNKFHGLQWNKKLGFLVIQKDFRYEKK